MTYVRAGQRFWGVDHAHGGWFVGSAALKTALVASGLPASPPVSDGGSSFPWAWRRRVRRPPAAPRAAPAGNHAASGAEKYRLNDDNPSVQPPSEETLVDRARRGDQAAFEALVLSYQSLAFRTAS